MLDFSAAGDEIQEVVARLKHGMASLRGLERRPV